MGAVQLQIEAHPSHKYRDALTHETPAPGHYDTGILAAYSLNARACMTGNKYIKEGKGSFMTSLHDDRSAPNMTEVTVDPTHYSDYYLQKESVGACSKASPNVLIRDGKLGFSSNIPRCVDAQFEDRSPLRGRREGAAGGLLSGNVMNALGGGSRYAGAFERYPNK